MYRTGIKRTLKSNKRISRKSVFQKKIQKQRKKTTTCSSYYASFISAHLTYSVFTGTLRGLQYQRPMCCGADCSLYKGHWGWGEQRCWNTACVLFNTLEERASFSNLHKSVILAWLPPKRVLGKNLDAGSLLGSNFRKHTGK